MLVGVGQVGPAAHEGVGLFHVGAIAQHPVGGHARFADETVDVVEVADLLHVAGHGLLVFEDEYLAVRQAPFGRRRVGGGERNMHRMRGMKVFMAGGR